jgi:hypothetical protein
VARKRHIEVKPHVRRPPGPRAPKPADLTPAPGPNEFDADQEQAMRQGQRQANMAPPAGEPDGDEGIGGLGRKGPSSKLSSRLWLMMRPHQK